MSVFSTRSIAYATCPCFWLGATRVCGSSSPLVTALIRISQCFKFHSVLPSAHIEVTLPEAPRVTVESSLRPVIHSGRLKSGKPSPSSLLIIPINVQIMSLETLGHQPLLVFLSVYVGSLLLPLLPGACDRSRSLEAKSRCHPHQRWTE